jgi:Dockerin type I domain
MNLHTLKSRFRLLVGLLVTLATISPAQTSDIVCPGSWKQVSSSGPAPRYHTSLAFEPRGAQGHEVLFGGLDQSSDHRAGDTWTWDGTVWIHAADAGPSPRALPAMAYDIAQRQMVLFGGVGTPGDPNKDNQDTWKWNGTKWTEVAAGGGPPARNGHGMAYDGARKKVVLFGGGVTFVGDIFNDTWEWDGTAWSQRSTAAAPSPRGEVGMVYDGAHARTVLFGGASDTKDLGDTWTWDGTVWTEAADTGPPARRHPGMVYDNARHRTVLFGGASGVTGSFFGDTWEWDGVRWTQVASAGPAARDAVGMAYDKTRGKAVLFGGTLPGGPSLKDTWEWTGPIYGCSGRLAGDLNCDHVVNHQDLTIVGAALGLPACSAADPRDLNHDGKINAQDAQLLANKCTELGCK